MTKKFFLFLTLAVSIAIFHTGCNTDACADKDCGFGLCLEDGACDCDPGYEYDANGSCTVLTQDKFVGSFDIHDECSASGSDDYVGSIAVGSSVSTINLNKVWNLFQKAVKADILGNNVTIARQQPDSDGYWVEGSGVLDPATNKIAFNFKITDEREPTNILTDNCVSTWKKK